MFRICAVRLVGVLFSTSSNHLAHAAVECKEAAVLGVGDTALMPYNGKGPNMQ